MAENSDLLTPDEEAIVRLLRRYEDRVANAGLLTTDLEHQLSASTAKPRAVLCGLWHKGLVSLHRTDGSEFPANDTFFADDAEQYCDTHEYGSLKYKLTKKGRELYRKLPEQRPAKADAQREVGTGKASGGIPSRPIPQKMEDTDGQSIEWDVFISHASEDKEVFVRPLAAALRAKSLRVWFDESALTVGDSLRRSIDDGLAHSRYGVVVISPDFLKKEWPQKELDGLAAREVEGRKVILPVWHNVDVETLRKCSPLLADRVAISTAQGMDAVVAALMSAMAGASALSPQIDN